MVDGPGAVEGARQPCSVCKFDDSKGAANRSAVLVIVLE